MPTMLEVIERQLDITLLPWQRQTADSPSNHLVRSLDRGVGKTTFLVLLALEKLADIRRASRVIYAAPSIVHADHARSIANRFLVQLNFQCKQSTRTKLVLGESTCEFVAATENALRGRGGVNLLLADERFLMPDEVRRLFPLCLAPGGRIVEVGTFNEAEWRKSVRAIA